MLVITGNVVDGYKTQSLPEIPNIKVNGVAQRYYWTAEISDHGDKDSASASRTNIFILDLKVTDNITWAVERYYGCSAMLRLIKC